MKTFTHIGIVSFLVCFSSLSAFSQAPSIKSVPDDALFHSVDDGFNISLPADMVQKASLKVSGNDRRVFVWEFSDALIAVGVETRAKAAETDADVAAVIADYKARIPKTQKILSESPASIGEYRGKSLVAEKDGTKTLHVILAWDKYAKLNKW